MAERNKRKYKRFNSAVFPKGKYFSKVSRYKIKKVERLLNERPRQILGFKGPYKVFAEKLAFFALES